MSKVVKIKIYKTKVKPVAVYGSETWAMTEMDRKRLGRGERNILTLSSPVMPYGIMLFICS